MKYDLESLFGISGKIAAVTGGGGILCGEMSRALGALGVKVAVLDLNLDNAKAVAKTVVDNGGTAIGVKCNVLEIASIEEACKTIESELGPVDILINGAGGNHPKATSACETIADQLEPNFFGLEAEGIQFVFNLNFIGTLLPTQVFAKRMAERKSGNIINLSSMSAYHPLTKVAAYSAAKAAISNFTEWLSVHFAPAGIRCNAIAPGFFLTDQNRFLLTDEKTGEPTERGRKIINNTPQGRYGTPDELIGALVWLLSSSASFVTGTVIPIDGGFNAYSGV